MPIEPSSLPAGIASATAGANIVMPTAAQRNVDLTGAFAEILGASFMSADQSSGVSTPKVGTFREKLNVTVTSSAVVNGTKKPGKSHPAADSPAPTPSDAAATKNPAIPVLMNGSWLLPSASPIAPVTDVSAAASVAISSDDASDSLAQQRLQNAISLTVVASSTDPSAGSVAQETGTTTSDFATNVFSSREATAVTPLRAPTITVGSNESGADSNGGYRLSQAASAVPSITSPNKGPVQHPSDTVMPSSVLAATAWNEMSSAVAAPPNEDPASAAPHSFTETQLVATTEQELRGVSASSPSVPTPSTSAGPTKGTSQGTGVVTLEGFMGSPLSPTVKLAPAQQEQPWQDASPGIATASTMLPDRSTDSVAISSSFASKPPVVQPQPTENAPMALAWVQPNVLHSLVSGDFRLSEPEKTDNDSPPTAAGQQVSPSQGKSTALSNSFQPIASAISNAAPTLPVPNTGSQAPRSAPATNLNSPATIVSVPAAQATLETNGGTLLTQGDTADPNTVASQSLVPSAVDTQAIFTPTGAQTAAPKQATTEFPIPQSVQAFPVRTETPNTDNSTHSASTEKSQHGAVPAIPFVSDSAVSLPQAGQSTLYTPTQKTNFHREDPQSQSPTSNAKMEVLHETIPGPPQAAPNLQLNHTGSSNAPAANWLLSPSTPVTAGADADSPSIEEGTEAPSSLPPNSTSAIFGGYGSESNSSTWPDAGTRAAFATESANPDAQTQTNMQTSRSQDSAGNASTEPLGPTFAPSDAPAAAQSLSVATSAPKTDALASAADGTAARLPSAPNDLGTPSELLARKPADNVELSSGLQAWNGGDNAQTRLIQSANLGGNLRSSEMSIALRAESLGPVELRTRVTGDVVGASIGVERHDVHAMIASELSALHQALNDRQLRVGELAVFHGSVQSGGATGDGRPSQRETAPQRPTPTGWGAEANSTLPEIAAFGEGSDAGALFDSNGRLSVRA